MPFAFKIFRRLARIKPSLVIAGVALACQSGDSSISAPVDPEFRVSRTAKPAAVSDLAVSSTADTAVTLSFTEVNDGTGSPASYDVRFATSPLSWGSATSVTRGTCTTPVAGTSIGAKRSCTVLGLTPSTAYQFQLIAFRGTLNQSAVFGSPSNVASTATLVTVVASVTVSPATASGNVGDVAQFSATATDAAGNVLTGRTVTWSSTNTAVVTVSATGNGTAVGGGTAAIVATCEGKTGQAQITVSGPPATTVASVAVSPSAASGNVGDAAQFTATLKDANGNVITGPAVTWSSTSSAVVTVSTTGYGTAVGAGSAAIVATSQGKSGQAQITVNGSTVPGPVASVTVSPSNSSIAIGGTQGFSAVLKDANGNVVNGAVTWSSTAPTIAGISLTGVVTGLLAGTTAITATDGAISGTAGLTVTVLPPPPPSGSWPNQPTGLTLLSDQPWNTLGSWVLNDNTAGHSSLVTLSGLPFSPSGALQDLSPIGMTGGGDAIGPGRADFYIPAAQQPTEIYVGMWVKLSSPYQPHSSGVQKIMYLHDNNGVNFSALWLEIYGTGSPFRASLVNQFYGCPSIRLDPNVTQTPIRPGEWHRYEMYVKMASTGSSSDGVLQVWVDGVLNVNRTDLCTQGSNTYKMESVRLSGMWGGVADSKTEVDYLWYDHTYVSGR
jgi:uncharacterized protein YjdB